MSEIVGKMKKSIKFALRQPGQAVASVINRLTVEPDVFDNKLGIVVIIKNEGPYIEEWVRYHLLVGADIIYIYDNESTDNTRQILEPYISSGKVVYKYFPGIAMQLPAYNDALRRYKNSCKYIAFIDADEFLFPLNEGESVANIVSSILDVEPKAGGLAVNWRMFGSSFHEEKPYGGGVLENYLYRAFENGKGNDCIKSVVNPRRVYRYCHVHYPMYYFGYYSIDETGRKVTGWFNINNNIKLLRINHYFTKSKEEWIARRSIGKADAKDRIKTRTMQEFYEHDNNDIYDASALYYSNLLNKDKSNA